MRKDEASTGNQKTKKISGFCYLEALCDFSGFVCLNFSTSYNHSYIVSIAFTSFLHMNGFSEGHLFPDIVLEIHERRIWPEYFLDPFVNGGGGSSEGLARGIKIEDFEGKALGIEAISSKNWPSAKFGEVKTSVTLPEKGHRNL